MVNKKLFAEHLEWAEARRPYPYEDSVGKLSIGVGRNLDDKGLREDEIDLLLKNDIKEALEECAKLDYFKGLDSVRQLVVADMVFNMGLPRFLGFVRTNEAIKKGDYVRASTEMYDSKWRRQTKRRAKVLIKAMRTGEWSHHV